MADIVEIVSQWTYSIQDWKILKTSKVYLFSGCVDMHPNFPLIHLLSKQSNKWIGKYLQGHAKHIDMKMGESYGFM